MRWRGRRQSSNVEDRRGQSRIPGGFGRSGRPMQIPIGRGLGGGGLSGIVILVIVFFALRACGIDPFQILEGGGPSSPQVSEQSAPGAQPTDEEAQFVSVVLAETEDVWNGIFQAEGETYTEPRMVLFSDQVQSACGFASSASGPFYCPGDSQLYIDLGFFRELSQRFGASGDFAQAYVVAHEVGHHVQNLIGVLPEFNRQRQSMSETDANEMSVRVELQADCFAGIWAHFTAQKGLLEDGDIEEALNAAHQIGDDTIQRRTQGYVVPESFNHGTSEQRATWFGNGLRNGRLADCDTFNNPV
ncbi:neutral zinc metallopeptidase [Mesorhizobium sp. CAU 1741]|uniref:KPN_02809 family neutral zinc metallopeptidase n=1 Tax=Mesorhizobium sp. CAU 1741 TaxID=3140366 RepID=UPI00325BA2BE